MISMEDISIALHLMVMWSGYCYLSLNFMGRILGRIRSTAAQVTGLMIKGVIINVVCGVVLGKIFAGQIWWELLYSLLIILYALSTFWIHYYTYSGSFLKVNIFAMCAELNYIVFFSISTILVNMLGSRQTVFDYMEPFCPADLLHPIIIAGLFETEYRVIKNWVPKIRAYEPVHRRVWWIGLLIYVCWGIESTILVLKRMRELNIGFYLVPVLFTMVLLVGLIRMTMRYQKVTQEKSAFLRARQEIMRLHHEVILRQAEGLERSRREIEHQMETLGVSGAGQISEERVRRYLSVLTGQYEQIRAGIYCRDMMTDAVLYHLAVKFRQQHIAFEFSFQDYDRGKIGAEDIAEILLQIQKAAEQGGAESIWLKTGCVKNLLIFEIKGPVFKELKRLKRQLLPIAAKYSGDIGIQKEDGRFFLRLQKEQDRKM